MGRLLGLSGGRRLVLALAVGGTAFGIAQAVQASIPDASGVIHGCYKTSAGALRVIDPTAGQKCLASETALPWSQAGPKGAKGATGTRGPSGTTGPQGSTGPTGPGGVSGYQVITNDQSYNSIGGSVGGIGNAFCPSGLKVFGGGGSASWTDSGGGFHGAVVTSSGPVGNDAWAIDGQQFNGSPFPSGATLNLETYAICADAS